jgi:glycosyltransferase involved in cell wall biosynthesis
LRSFGATALLAADRKRPVLSVVTPCFNEEANIGPLCSALGSTLDALAISYELVLVENGSSDGTYPLMLAAAKADPRIKIVQLSRNFTYQGGIAAGMAYARGEFVVCIDADLQDPVEMIPELLRTAQEGSYDIVYGVRRTRQETLWKRWSYRAFYRLMRWLAPFHVPEDAGDFAIMSRRAVDAILRLPERDRFVRGLRAWVGFRSCGVPYDRKARTRGESHFSFGALVLIAFQGLFSFSFVPLRAMFYLGVAIFLSVVPLIAGYAVWREMAPGAWPPGIATIIILQFLTLGFVAGGIGLLGMYLSVVFTEVKARPTFLVSRLVNLEEDPP